MTVARLPSLAPCPHKTLNNARLGSYTPFAELIRANVPGHHFISILQSTLRAWHPAVLDFPKPVENVVVAGAVALVDDTRQTLFTDHAVILVKNNGSCKNEIVYVDPK